MKRLTLAMVASFLILCTAASAQTVTLETYSKDPACKAAVKKICPGVKPGGGRIHDCLKQHNTSMKQLCPNDVSKKQTQDNSPVVVPPVATPPAGQ